MAQALRDPDFDIDEHTIVKVRKPLPLPVVDPAWWVGLPRAEFYAEVSRRDKINRAAAKIIVINRS